MMAADRSPHLVSSRVAKRKYLFYTGSLSGGGAEPVWSLLASEFAERGDEVVLALDDYGEPSTPPSPKVDIQIVGTGALAGVTRLGRLLRRLKPDAALSAIAANSLKLVLANLTSGGRTPVVMSVHGLLEQRTGRLSAAAMHGLPLLGRFVRRIVCVSDGVRRVVVEEWGADPAKTVRIYNPVPPQHPAESIEALMRRPPHVVALGRLSPDKGFDVLIDAFAAVQTEGASLAIAGKGHEQAALAARIDALGLSDRVKLVGFVDPAALYRTARLCAVPSRSEAFGLVVAEALSAGLAIVATKCDGPGEILDGGRFGRIVPIEDAPALARAIDAALADPGAPGPRIERARAFSVETAVAAWTQLLDEVVAEGR